MAEFTVTGVRDGEAVRVTWRDGELFGADEPLLAWIRHVAAAQEGTVQGLPGLPSSMTDHLSNPYAAYAIIRSVFPGKTTLDRSLPTIYVPEGAIT